jgi:glutathione S-transferase
MILYGSTMSPFVRKVAAYAVEKGIELDIQQTGFPNPTPEFCTASPFRKMPALVDGDYCLSDSTAIIHYLEAKYPEPELIPAEPRARGRVIWFHELADTSLFGCGA